MSTTNAMQINRFDTIDPQEFRWVGMYYFGTSPDVEELYKADHADLGEITGDTGRFWNASNVVKFHENGGCATCGTNHSYGSVFEHTPTGVMYGLGNICSADKFTMPDKVSMRRLAADKKLANAREKARALAEYKVMCNATPGLENALDVDHNITQSIKRSAIRYGNLSQKQIALVFKLAFEAYCVPEPVAPVAEVAKVPVPETNGKLVTLTGVVSGTKWQENNFGSVLKMRLVCETPDGEYVVWGTVPAKLRQAQDADLNYVFGVGSKIQFGVKKLVQSDDDPSFGFYNGRATQPKFL